MNLFAGKRREKENYLKKSSVGGKRVKKLIQEFIDDVHNRPHLSPLLNRVSLNIMVETENQSFVMSIQHNKMIFINEPKDHPDVTIQLLEDRLIDLLYGKIKLRELMNDPTTKIQSSFRHLLLVESIFLLGMEKKRS